MNIRMRAAFNRWRRRLLRQLLGRIVFGERSQGRDLPFTRIAPSVVIEHEDRLTLGDHVYIGPFCYLEASSGLTIGEGVQITSHVSIVSHSSHRSARLLGRAFVSWQGPRPGWVGGEVHIGPYSFIGPHTVIEAGTRLVGDARTSMDDIVVQVKRVSDLISEIGAATIEQTTGIGQVSTAVSQLDQATQQNAALVEESAAAAESLKQQASKLASVVSVFKLAT